jgi:hypothetical protein
MPTSNSSRQSLWQRDRKGSGAVSFQLTNWFRRSRSAGPFHGSHLLHPESGDQEALERHIAQASILLSGRHLQHGDASQPTRPGEVFTNCLEFNTLISTLEYGVVKIGSVVGETVTIRTKDGEWRAAPVSSHGCQKLYQLTFGNPNRSGVSYEVAATRNHRWFLDDGALTDHIEIGDRLQFAPLHEDLDEEAIRHGIIFGGSAPKYRQARPGCEVSQGRDYISIRLCKTKQEYLKYFNRYGVTYPRSASGDPVVYVGKKAHWKQVPFTRDPSYIAGFIHGWWLADGSKGVRGNVIEITTTNADAVDWLYEHVGYVGYVVTMDRVQERKPGDGSYNNGSAAPIHYIRLRKNSSLTLIDIQDQGEEVVFCVEEPVTSSFVLANGLVTGNCSTAMLRAPTFRLLNGSGVGTCYDDDLQLVDLTKMQYKASGFWSMGKKTVYRIATNKRAVPRHSQAEGDEWL